MQRWHNFFDRTVPNMTLRLVLMLIGLVFFSSSVALTKTTGLGTSPISTIPAVLSYMTPLTIGIWTFILNVGFVLVQVILLRRDFSPVQFFQIPLVFVFSALIDFFVPIFELIPMSNYIIQLAFSFLGCTMTAFGVFLMVKASILTLPGEGIILAISKTTGIEFPRCKIAFDSSMVVSAAILSLVSMGGLFGVREGTIISAVCTGIIVGLFNKAFPNFEQFCPLEGHATYTATSMVSSSASVSETEPADASAAPLVITIAREYGSGGREIAHLIGDKLGIPVYDTSLVTLTARESGLTESYVKEHEEEVRRGLAYNIFMQNYQVIGQNPDANDSLWLAQARTITNLADSRSCVIVGRCGNQILSDRDNVFNVFVHAPLEQRIKRVIGRDKLTEKMASSKIKRIDSERAEHCKRCTGTVWGAPDNYHLSIDSSLTSPEKTAKIISDLALDA